MVLAAGLGTRMRPLTLDRPKPLVEVAGKTMLDHCLDKLADAGVARAVVNVHYLPEQIVEHLRGRHTPKVTISDESHQLLETGGGMVHALPLIGADPFFAMNSDNLFLYGPEDVFHQLSSTWDPEKMDALLLVVPHARAVNFKGEGDFHMDGSGRLSLRKPGRIAPFIYTGLQIVSHRLLRDAPRGPFGTMILWKRAMEEGRLFGAAHHGTWFEVGTPEAIAPTEAMLASA